MDHLSSCYFCGTALDRPLQTVQVVESLDSGKGPMVTLCSTCHHKLEAIFESGNVANRLVSPSDSPDDLAETDGNPGDTEAVETRIIQTDQREAGRTSGDDEWLSADDEGEWLTGGEIDNGAMDEEEMNDGQRDDGELEDGERKGGEREDGERKGGEREDGERKGGEREDGELNGGEQEDEGRDDEEMDDAEQAGEPMGDKAADDAFAGEVAAGESGDQYEGTNDAGHRAIETTEERQNLENTIEQVMEPDIPPAGSDDSPTDSNDKPTVSDDTPSTNDSAASGGEHSDVGGDQGKGQTTITALEYNKIMRLLQNREFPVARGEIVDIASSAYDLSRDDCGEIIDLAVERDLLVESDGELYRPE